MSIQTNVVAIHQERADLLGKSTTIITYDPDARMFCVQLYLDGDAQPLGVKYFASVYDVLRMTRYSPLLHRTVVRWLRSRQ